MKQYSATAFKSDLVEELRQADETTNRNDYARLLAGKSAKTPLQFLSKTVKEKAATEDYEHVLACLAEATLGTMGDDDTLEPTPEPSAPVVLPLVIEEEESSAIAAQVVVVQEPAPAPQPAGDVTASGIVLTSTPAPTGPSNLDIILSAAVPATTKTYSPLSHLDLITSVKEQLDKRGLAVKDERYTQNRNGQQMFGHLTVQGLNGEQDMCLGFRNSYDKTMQVGVVGGSRVIVCSNLMFAGDFKSLAMHNGNIVQELNTMLGKAADRLEEHYRKLQLDSEKMKQVEVNPRLIHEILGELFYSEQVVSEAQLRIIRAELKEQTNFGDGSLWDIYNHTTEALKTTPSGLVIGRHIEAHQFYLAKA
ncbi:DUF932 domain-containing protein [Hymenobacter sp. BT175]|uniref:DUF932 domain-containing protein n=1 Tax=Hymenobacter translucens TaxID=2886507 RepID=UPI001D0EFB21|nr:DUF932 domain-containing protein [Hymenobacter translucens]MCC2546417.1 DUF932 domain-containing protein [Hymenobacter translucens]